jgi:hypothetical protein
MTVPDAKNAKNENVFFDPLVKLTKPVIQSVPVPPSENKEKQVASQFFNRGMFETMVNRSLSSVFSGQLLDKEGDTLNTKLKKAVENNNINENIRLTLETLFRPNSIITIGGKPYTIISYQWTNGDWKVDTKLYTLNNNIVNASPYGRKGPIIIQNFMGPRAPNDYSQAQKELKLLDKEVLEGDDFNKKGYVKQQFIEKNPKGAQDTTTKDGKVSPGTGTQVTKDKDDITLGIPIGKDKDVKNPDATPNGKKEIPIGKEDVEIKDEIKSGPLSQDDEINKCLQEYEECISNANIKQEASNSKIRQENAPTKSRDIDVIESKEDISEISDKDYSLIEAKENEDESVNLKKLPEESFKDSEKEKKNYSEKNSKTWIEKYMKNNNYTIKDNEGKGDCFFAVIRDAFSSIGKTKYSVEYLRELIAEASTQKIFDSYKEVYTLFENLLNQQKKDLENYENFENRLNKINKKIKNIKKFLKLTQDEMKKDEDEIKKVIEEIKEAENDKDKIEIINSSIRRGVFNFDYFFDKYLNMKIAQLKSEIMGSEINLIPYKFMKNINTLDEFKNILKTCEFWADSWAISTMERVLKIKIIILTDPDLRPPPTSNSQNIVQCGEMDPILQEECEFKPEYYIITDYTGDHYKLIGYKGTEIFTFPEIPYGLKELATRTCMAKNSGLYSLIPEFQKFRDEELGFKGKKRYGLRGVKGGGEPEEDIPIANSIKPSTPVVRGELVPETMIVEGVVENPPAEVVKKPEPIKKEPEVEPVFKTPSAPETIPIQKHINSLFFSDSKLGYFIVIDLELYPGTSIPLRERPSLGCKIQKEKIKESLAEVRGTVYRPTPQNELYTYNPLNGDKNITENTNKSIKTKKQKGGFKKRTRKNKKQNKKENKKQNKQNKTRKQKRNNTKTCKKR